MPLVPRLSRYPLDLATGLSLVLCVGAIGLWISGYWVACAFIRDTPTGSIAFTSEIGYAAVMTVEVNYMVPHPPKKTGWHFHRMTANSNVEVRYHSSSTWNWLGVGGDRIGKPVGKPDAPTSVVFISTYWAHFWIVVIAFALLPSLRLVQRLRERRGVSIGLCRRCGYDLRATPMRCPECGNTQGDSQ
jgi:hypothetical protein